MYIFVLAVLMLSCSEHDKSSNLMNDARKYMDTGQFSRLFELAASAGSHRFTDAASRRELDSMADYARRFMIDFPHSQADIIELLRADNVEADERSLREWEERGELEYMDIDLERRYFRWAHRNLYRINDSLRAIKQIDKQRDESLFRFCISEIKSILQASAVHGYGNPVNPRTFRISYTITVNADVVPPGEIIRCWMPFSREDSPRQDMVRVISTDPCEHVVSSDTGSHRSIFFEKPAVSGKPTVFSIGFEFRSWGQYFEPSALAATGNNDLPHHVSEFLGERVPHISFSDDIRELTESLVTPGMVPYEKVRAFYRWINDNIIWTSAVEYGLMADIPAYVLKNGRGDCGMQTLLFLSMCRYAGIPARWESGWMLHRDRVNLHDWSEVYLEPAGWVPVDVSFRLQPSDDRRVSEFYITGMDSYRLIVNNDYGRRFDPPKKYPRSEPLDFQRGELEWDGGNIYFDQWTYRMQVEYY